MQDIGIPSELHSNDAKELAEGKMKEILKKFWIKGTQSEPYSPWQVHAELCIRKVKKQSKTHYPCLVHLSNYGIIAQNTIKSFVT